MRDQSRIKGRKSTMAENKITKETNPRECDSESMDELLEKIRELEEDNRRKDDEIRFKDDEVKRLKKENEIFQKENEIFRKVLRTKSIDADDVLAKYLKLEAEDVIEELDELHRKVNMNSSNSSLPPSSDRPWHRLKKRSLRTKSGKKAGGQIGHPGSTITVPHEADSVIMLYPPGCGNCPKRDECESDGRFTCAEKRTVVDIVVSTTVTEYRALRRTPCPSASAEGDVGIFPENVRGYVQYGDGVAVFASVLDTYGAMSDKRIAEVINGVSGLNMSSSTVIAMTGKCADAVAPAMEPIAEAVASGKIANCDETSTRAVVEVKKESDDGKDAIETESGEQGEAVETECVCRNVWIHGASNDGFTCLRMSTGRGYDGMVEADVLPHMEGTIIHDSWAPYWKFAGLKHGLCNAHILRELKSVTENRPEHEWADMFADLLIRMKTEKENAIASGETHLSNDVLEGFRRRYAEILDYADNECPPPQEPSVKKRGKKKKGKERSLIERLRLREAEICLFVKDFDIDFDNNLAERAFRFVKTKTKVSGCFRSTRCLKQYLDIMSYVDTARKHGVSAFKALSMAFKGQWAEAIGLF